MNKKLIIDFDSTFVKTEGLEELAEIALEEKENKKEIVEKIKRITALGMEGSIGFDESLERRVKILGANKSHVERLAENLKDDVSDSVLANKDFFKKNCDDIYILSGGFIDFMLPVLIDFKIKKENILANSFVYNEANEIVGFDKKNPLSQVGGKVKALKRLALDGEVVMLGDGWTDYEVREAGLADIFIAFTENVKRDNIVDQADFVANNFDEVINLLK